MPCLNSIMKEWTTFRPSEDGQTMDINLLNNKLASSIQALVSAEKTLAININIPIKIIHPNITPKRLQHGY